MSLQPASGGNVWGRFTVDPRVATRGDVRASDADRDVLSSVLADAYAEGRLDGDEYNDRLGRAMAVKRIGEVRPLIDDLVVETGQPLKAGPGPQVAAPDPGKVTGITLTAWIGMAVLFNLIWLFTSFSSGYANYYWPMWPMLGTAIPAFIAILTARSGGNGRTDRRQLGR